MRDIPDPAFRQREHMSWKTCTNKKEIVHDSSQARPIISLQPKIDDTYDYN
jgi:hypothetical protein